MNKSCIVFACTIYTEDRLFTLKEFLHQFEKNFTDSDIYIGINPGTLPSVEKILQESNLSIVAVGRASSELYTQSDASAYQVALKLLKDSGRTYDTIWFLHTKGGVNSHSDYLRKWYIDNFLEDKSYIENFLADNPGIGSYGLLGVEYNTDKQYLETDTEVALFQNILSKEFPYTHVNFFYIHTLYVIKGEVLNKFFSTITGKWFNSKLDRYYFEGVFPFIVSRSGYFPYISNRRSMNGVDLLQIHSSWISENNLLSYSKYLGTYRTDYIFNQLSPPYVSSNTQP
jgi:hypothetical protein